MGNVSLPERFRVVATRWWRTVASTIEEHAAVTLSLIACIATSLCLWIFGSGRLQEFGLNAFTESLGIVITVLVIDSLIRRRERRRLRPLELAAFTDVQSLVSGLTSIFGTAHQHAGKGVLPDAPKPASTHEIWTPHFMLQLRSRLDLNESAPVVPSRTWERYLIDTATQYRQLGERILERHAGILDPKAYLLVHDVVHGLLSPSIGFQQIPTLRTLGGFGSAEDWEKLPEEQRHVLGRYWICLDEHLTSAANLNYWYHDSHQYYHDLRAGNRK